MEPEWLLTLQDSGKDIFKTNEGLKGRNMWDRLSQCEKYESICCFAGDTLRENETDHCINLEVIYLEKDGS